jgi:hypothetical protein
LKSDRCCFCEPQTASLTATPHQAIHPYLWRTYSVPRLADIRHNTM